ncbi:MAG: hypothetical protein ACFFC7_04825 [Candidatus Hermodarchaeota archaeon]
MSYSFLSHSCSILSLVGDTWWQYLDVMDYGYGQFYPWSTVFDAGHVNQISITQSWHSR